ncbi:MAG: hypothetical protein K1X89_22710 [Myxococcaceae bacterium]|nr:hypothetical protein [Myxococcaceae bacterium]
MSVASQGSSLLAVAVACGVFSACGPGELVREDQLTPDLAQVQSGLRACAGPNTVQGIDVSGYQPNTNWAQVKAAGKQFAIIKATEGTGYVNPYFARDWAGTKANGMIRGAYHFFRPGTNAVAQADHFVSTMGALGDGDLPGMLDLEVTDGLGPSAVAAAVRAFVDRVEQRSGRRPIIYTGYYFWNGQVGNPQGYGSYPLVMAAYVSGCPLIPDEWSKFTMWQYSSSGSVSGVSTRVDLDVFNGTLADLQALARPPAPPNAPPHGYLDGASGTAVGGWAQDPDAPTAGIDVHVYFNGPAGSPAATGVAVHANQSRADLCGPLGSCNHAFSLATPRSVCDGQAHEVHAYGIDSAGGANAELSQSPKSVTCQVSLSGVKRHVTDPTSYAAWAFSPFSDQATVSDAALNALGEIAVWPAAPVMIRGDGQAAVYLVDSGFKRHVPSPEVAARWHLDLAKVKVVTVAEVDALPTAAPLRSAPELVKGTGPAVYVIDDALPVVGTKVPATIIRTLIAVEPTTTEAVLQAGVIVHAAAGFEFGSAPGGSQEGSGSPASDASPMQSSGGCSAAGGALSPLVVSGLALLLRRRRARA